MNRTPEYSNRLYAIIANQYIGKEVVLPASRKKSASKYFIEYIHKIPRSIQQRIAVGSETSWNNIVYIYNSFADELGYEKITTDTAKNDYTKSKPLRMCDMKDGMYIHKDHCWW